MADAATTSANDSSEPGALVAPARIHPLFYVQRDGDLEIDLIGFTVERHYGDRPSEAAARQFRGEEIADLQALADRFGGGHYVLKARTERGQIVKGGTRVHYIDEDAFPPQPLLRAKRAPALAQVAPAPVAAAPVAQQSDLAAVVAAMQSQTTALVASIQAQSRESMGVIVQALQTVVSSKTTSTDEHVMNGAAMMMRLQADADARALDRLTSAREMAAGQNDDLGSTIDSLVKGAAVFGPMLAAGKPDGGK